MKKFSYLASAITCAVVLASCGDAKIDIKDDGGNDTPTGNIFTVQMNELGYQDIHQLSAANVNDVISALINKGHSISDVESAMYENAADNFVEHNLAMGTWLNSGVGQAILLGRHYLSTYDLSMSSCATGGSYRVVSNSAQRMLVQALGHNQIEEWQFSGDGQTQLVVSGSGIDGSYDLQDRPTAVLVPNCVTDTGKGATVSVKLRDLPEQIRPANVNYAVRLTLDLNHSGEEDTGDVRVIFRDVASMTDDIVDISSLMSNLFVRWTDGSSMRGSSNPQLDTQFTITGDTIEFDLPQSLHTLMEQFDQTTPLFVEVAADYLVDNEPVFGSNLASDDGPWNWTNVMMKHEDRFPEQGYVASGDGVEHQDAANDQVGEAGWVDILSVKVEFK